MNGTPAKSAYSLPSMEEVDAVPDNGLRVVSTFSGCGGSCLGFRMAGYRTLWASEFIDSAREVYELNHPGVLVDGRDIREVNASEILAKIDRDVGDVDVLEGSPPCASFSTAGTRDNHWGEVVKYSETTQRVDDLFWEFARLLRGIKPRAFVAENTSGLVKGVAKGYFKNILAELRSCGYVVKARMLDAQWLGVPQRRQRVIFVGVRLDLSTQPAFPVPLRYRYTIADALPSIRSLKSVAHGYFPGLNMKASDGPAPTVAAGPSSAAYNNHQVLDVDTSEDVSIDRYAIGDEWKRLRPGESSDKYFNLVRPRLEEPCPTVTQMGGHLSAASVTHPTEPRKFTIDKLKRICGFPADFQMTGSYQQRWERLGRAVPPPMMYHVARVVRDEVLTR